MSCAPSIRSDGSSVITIVPQYRYQEFGLHGLDDLFDDSDGVSITSLFDGPKQPRASAERLPSPINDGVIIAVPFAVAAGLSTVGSSYLSAVGGLLLVVANALAMSMGFWLEARLKAAEYDVQEAKEHALLYKHVFHVKGRLYRCLGLYGLEEEILKEFVERLVADREMCVKASVAAFLSVSFIMHIDHKLHKPKLSQSRRSAFTLLLAHLTPNWNSSSRLVGLLPLFPYIIAPLPDALHISIAISTTMLFVLGYLRAMYFGCSAKAGLINSILTLAMGGLVAGCTFGIGKGLTGIWVL
ncbi:hypothetical protein K402DRAFT_406086 [Aulographum hederae CBS 113979]|uniref:Uncharacterized protein n=1 Tax=Aulographum hederae CBS 113979 TaxID=1176131 RepID=A0A6G1GU04_9PEZI|nr:hypothetical protein K402DRAFT_406086 [Aulographum hederae CBS 113979]